MMQKGRVTSSHSISYGPFYIVIYTHNNPHDNDINKAVQIFFKTIDDLNVRYSRTELHLSSSSKSQVLSHRRLKSVDN